jgi:hypothetical protein
LRRGGTILFHAAPAASGDRVPMGAHLGVTMIGTVSSARRSSPRARLRHVINLPPRTGSRVAGRPAARRSRWYTTVSAGYVPRIARQSRAA